MANSPVFHSENIRDTKAREKREIFVKVEEKKTLKQSAEEFQKKFAEAKAHAAESRAKIENPGADENGVIRSHTRKPFPTKAVLKIAIPILLLGGIALATYLNWGTIYHQFFEVSEARAGELLPQNPEQAAAMYKKLIAEETNSKEKERKSLLYAYKLLNSCDGEEKNGCSDTFLRNIYDLANIAEEIAPSQYSAELLATYYTSIGNETEAEKWIQLSESRDTGEGGLGEG